MDQARAESGRWSALISGRGHGLDILACHSRLPGCKCGAGWSGQLPVCLGEEGLPITLRNCRQRKVSALRSLAEALRSKHANIPIAGPKVGLAVMKVSPMWYFLQCRSEQGIHNARPVKRNNFVLARYDQAAVFVCRRNPASGIILHSEVILFVSRMRHLRRLRESLRLCGSDRPSTAWDQSANVLAQAALVIPDQVDGVSRAATCSPLSRLRKTDLISHGSRIRPTM